MVPFRRVCVCLSAVIGVQVHLFDLLHQRIPGIGASALVVEGLLHHFVQTAQEGLFGNTVFPNGVVDADLVHEFRNDRKGRHFGAGDFAYDLGEHKSDDALRTSIADALGDFFGNRQDCDIF